MTDNGTAEEAAKKEKTEAERKKKEKEDEAAGNFATPLVGTFLNLPQDPVMIKCPACGTKALSTVENDLQWWAAELNRLYNCLFVTFCCCCCFSLSKPCQRTDRNHYCQNCSCFFGRAQRHEPLKLK